MLPESVKCHIQHKQNMKTLKRKFLDMGIVVLDINFGNYKKPVLPDKVKWYIKHTRKAEDEEVMESIHYNIAFFTALYVMEQDEDFLLKQFERKKQIA